MAEQKKYDELKISNVIRIAFQKVNFLRDLKADFDDLIELTFQTQIWII